MRNEARLLQRWAEAPRLIRFQQQRIVEYRELINEARGLTGVANDGQPHGSTTGNPTEQKALRVLKLEDEYSSYIEKLEENVRRINEDAALVDGILTEMGSVFYEIERLRFVDKLSWVQISFSLNYSEGYIRNLHSRVLTEIKKKA